MINPSFFITYDENNNQIQTLMNSESDLSNAKAAIVQVDHQISEAQKQLAITAAREKSCSQRIYRNEHPHFFHFFVKNRKQKVAALKQEHSSMITQHTSIEATINDAKEKKKLFQAQLNTATQQKQILDACLAKQQTMFHECISSVSASPQLQQLEKKLEHAKVNLAQEEALAQSLTQILSSLEQAKILFEESISVYSRACMWNNRAISDTRWDGAGYFERRDQFHRDMFMNQARIPAIQAYDVAAQGLQAFPQELHTRFPEIASQVGAVPLPQLPMVQFGYALRDDMYGYMGATMNDMNSAYVIQQNQQTVAQCARMMQQQIICCRNMLALLDSSIAQMKAIVESDLRDCENERHAIFQMVRESVFHVHVVNMSHHVVPVALHVY